MYKDEKINKNRFRKMKKLIKIHNIKYIKIHNKYK